MGNPPDVIFIVRYVAWLSFQCAIGSSIARHGARLDAVNPQWHLTSATPYDPPLTYGGWKQSQALGARIGNILHAREVAIDSAAVSKEVSTAAVGDAQTEVDGRLRPEISGGKGRKQRLIIHTSPFLRCIQTSIAISAGVEQYRGSQKSKPPSATVQPHPHHQPRHYQSPRLRAREHRNSFNLSAIPEPDEIHAGKVPPSVPHPRGHTKGRLRLDAFLGEWLCPEYFDMITTPPDSKMMVASAKADLLRLKPTEIVHSTTGPPLSRGNFPGGWGQSTARGTTKDSKDEPLANMSELGQSLPEHGRSDTQHRSGVPKNINSQREHQHETGLTAGHGRYIPLEPALSISPLDGIPAGYVAHAQEACLEIDYRWDSMRLPHDWGDGGVIGEEWSSMHKRFRRGLQSMITWYRTCDTTERKAYLKGEATSENGPRLENDEEMETVLVLVTHGAGCNALIGALTNQPVLLDVGMASLTMAVRKARTNIQHASSDPTSAVTMRRRSVIDSGVSEDYEVKMIASTDHLRSPQLVSATSRTYRFSPTPRTHTPTSRHHSSSVGSRTPAPITSNLHFSVTGNPGETVPNSTGLWTKPIPPITRKQDLDLSTPRAPPPKNQMGELHDNNEDDDDDDDNETKSLAATHNGLWAAAPPQALNTTARKKGTKRRWTHSEHQSVTMRAS